MYKLNPAQREVVQYLNGPCLVVAGAGSGKTLVIEYRVVNLINHNINPSQILLLTFTRKAATQMLLRAAKHNYQARNVSGGTFHSFAYSILNKYSKVLKLNTFVILDEEDSQQVISWCTKQLGLDKLEKPFPKKDQLRKIFASSINKNLSVEKIIEDEYPVFSDWTSEIIKINKKYQEIKKEHGYMDYEDLLVNLYYILKEQEKLRSYISQQFCYIMVDEYQDTNTLQAEIVYLMAKEHQNICVVGDDAQSIYRFRGATHRNIMTFVNKFPNCKVFKLEANYRSQQKILDVANAILSQMRHRYFKQLYSAKQLTGEMPYLILCRNSFNEASWIADKISENLNKGITLAEQAVLFRSSYVSIPVQIELQKRSIPFKVWGGMAFQETAHVKDLLSYFRLLVNPMDEIALRRVLLLVDGIGPKTAQQIIKEFRFCKNNISLANFLSQRFHRPQLERLISLFKKLEDPSYNLKRKYECLLHYYKPILENKYDDVLDRLQDLEVLKEIILRYEDLRDIENFLADFVLEISEDQPYLTQETKKESVTLSTIHSAKGLEWRVVFVMGLVEGVLPSSFSFDNPDALDEEHRLLYVALTRAKEMLFLSASYEQSSYGLPQTKRLSRFIDSKFILSYLKSIIVDYNSCITISNCYE
ncbi:MAG: ATP-dependent helicase [Candidatus Omnitrophica bacterium]|nr:ATP-dependent helicase [Candidatus Omnitrophota bacterium]